MIRVCSSSLPTPIHEGGWAGTRFRQRRGLRPYSQEEAMGHALAAARHHARRVRVTQNSKLRTQNYYGLPRHLSALSTPNRRPKR